MTVKTCDVTIINKLGLHARASAKLVEVACGFKASIKIGRGERLVDARSIMSLLMLGAGHGSELRLAVDGEDADLAFQAILDLIARRFDEAE